MLSIKLTYEEIFGLEEDTKPKINELQEKIVHKYKLSKRQIDKKIYGIVPEKTVQRTRTSLMKTANYLLVAGKEKEEMINTSSSLKKDKCVIRIKKGVTKKKIP